MSDIADQIDAAIGAAPPDAPGLDATLALGRRALLRRRWAYGVGAAATVVVIGGSAWAVVPGDGGPSRSDAPGFVDRTTPTTAAPLLESDAPGDQGGQGDGSEWPGVERDDLVRFSQPQLSLPEPGTLVPVHDTEILEQRPGADVGDSFAAPDDVTGVALVASEGSRAFVLARIVDGGPAQYIAVPTTRFMDTLDEFLAFARERYAEGGGGLL